MIGAGWSQSWNRSRSRFPQAGFVVGVGVDFLKPESELEPESESLKFDRPRSIDIHDSQFRHIGQTCSAVLSYKNRGPASTSSAELSSVSAWDIIRRPRVCAYPARATAWDVSGTRCGIVSVWTCVPRACLGVGHLRHPVRYTTSPVPRACFGVGHHQHPVRYS